MAIQRSLKAIGAATILALALATGVAWAAGKQGHEHEGMGHEGMGHEAMKAHHEKMNQLAGQLSEHTQMMKGIQDHDQLSQEMIKHQEMIDQIMTEMVEQHKAMGEMMGGRHGGKGSMMQHRGSGMMEHKEHMEHE